jgi:DNA-binding NarL/FixJ family response regulator
MSQSPSSPAAPQGQSATIRVLIVDDHPLMRDALRAAIEDEPDMAVAGEACNGEQALDLMRALRPDVTVMDLFMPIKDGLDAIAQMRREQPESHILALTSSADEEKIVSAVQAGALGYLLKDAQRVELLEAIREVSRGHSYLPQSVALKLMNGMRQGRAAPPDLPPAPPPSEPLTERELDVLRLIGQGATNQDIAAKLGVAEGTVRTHVHHILAKLGLANRNQAIVYALRQGLVDL